MQQGLWYCCGEMKKLNGTELTRLITEWAETRGTSPSKMLRSIHVSPSRLHDWDHGSRPERDRLEKLADLMGVPRDRLLGMYGYASDKGPDGLTKAEVLLLEWFRMIPVDGDGPERRLFVLQAARTQSGLSALESSQLRALIGNRESSGDRA